MKRIDQSRKVKQFSYEAEFYIEKLRSTGFPPIEVNGMSAMPRTDLLPQFSKLGDLVLKVLPTSNYTSSGGIELYLKPTR